MTDKLIVFTTTDSREQADNIAETLVERRLAACVNIVGPIRSVYRWQDHVDRTDEFQLHIKTHEEHFAAVRDAIKELNTYELPECIAVRIEHGSEQYLQWVGKETA